MKRLNAIALVPTLAALALAAVLAAPGFCPVRAAVQDPPAGEAANADTADARGRMHPINAIRKQVSEATVRLQQAQNDLQTLEARLREARLGEAPPETLQRLEAEIAATRQLVDARKAEQADLSAQLGAAERDLAALQEQERQKDLAEADRSRRTAQEQADQVLAEARRVAGESGPDAAAALRNAISDSQLQMLRAEYADIQQRADRLRQLAEVGGVTTEEYSSAQTKAQMALARLRQAAYQQMLDQVEQEREGFAQRNEGTPAEVTGHVLQTEFFRGYLDSVQQYARLSSEPETAAVAAVVTAADLLRDQPPQATIDYFEPMLRELREQRERFYIDPQAAPPWAVESAVRLQLAEAYNAAGQREQALGVLREIILRHQPAASTRPATP